MGNKQSSLPTGEYAINRITNKITSCHGPHQQNHSAHKFERLRSKFDLDYIADSEVSDMAEDPLQRCSGSQTNKSTSLGSFNIGQHTDNEDDEFAYLINSKVYNSLKNSFQESSANPSNMAEVNSYEHISSIQGADHNIRQSYLLKLINIQNHKENKISSMFKSIFITSWDDTLFCTSYLTPKGVYVEPKSNYNQKVKAYIDKIEVGIVKLFSTALGQGADIYIISDAKKGWIEESISKFLPRVKIIVDSYNLNKVNLVYTSDYDTSSSSFTPRYEAINSIMARYSDYYPNGIFNIICMTDSMLIIQDLTLIVKEEIGKKRETDKDIYLKTLILKDTPEVADIIRQQQLVSEQFVKIYGSIKNMNIKVGAKR